MIIIYIFFFLYFQRKNFVSKYILFCAQDENDSFQYELLDKFSDEMWLKEIFYNEKYFDMEIAARVDLLSLIPQHNFVELARETLLKRYYFQRVIFFSRNYSLGYRSNYLKKKWCRYMYLNRSWWIILKSLIKVLLCKTQNLLMDTSYLVWVFPLFFH